MLEPRTREERAAYKDKDRVEQLRLRERIGGYFTNRLDKFIDFKRPFLSPLCAPDLLWPLFLSSLSFGSERTRSVVAGSFLHHSSVFHFPSFAPVK